MATDPYSNNLSDKDVDIKFTQELKEIFSALPEAHSAMAACNILAQQISQRMKEIRSLSVEERIKIYLNQRILNQKNWYSSKSEINQKEHDNYFFLILGCEVIGIILAALMIKFNLVINPVGFITTLAAIFTGWAQIKKFREQSQSYALAEQELLSAESLASHIKDELSLNEYIRDTENIFSREHTMWCAKRG